MAFMAGLGAPPGFDARAVAAMRRRARPDEGGFFSFFQPADDPCLPRDACEIATKLAIQANDFRLEGLENRDVQALKIASNLASQAKSQVFKIRGNDGSRLATQIDLLRQQIAAAAAAIKADPKEVLALPTCPSFAVRLDTQMLGQMRGDLADLKRHAARGAAGASEIREAKQNLGVALRRKPCRVSDQAEQKRIFAESGKVRVAFTKEEAAVAAKEGAAKGAAALASLDPRKLLANLTKGQRLALAVGAGLVALLILRPYVAPITRRL